MMMGAVMLVEPVLEWSPSWQTQRPVYLHFLFIGWVTQIIMEVGFWIFPKYSKEHPRGNEKVGWVVFGLLNLGLILRAIGEPMMVLSPVTNSGGCWLSLHCVFCWQAAQDIELKVQINTTVTRYNLNDLSAILKLVREQGVMTWSVLLCCFHAIVGA
jgi:hypothetical protein